MSATVLIIEHEAERLEELIAQLLATRAGDIHLDTHIDLVPLLQHLCADANFEGKAQGVQVIFTTGVTAWGWPSPGVQFYDTEVGWKRPIPVQG